MLYEEEPEEFKTRRSGGIKERTIRIWGDFKLAKKRLTGVSDSDYTSGVRHQANQSYYVSPIHAKLGLWLYILGRKLLGPMI